MSGVEQSNFNEIMHFVFIINITKSSNKNPSLVVTKFTPFVN